MARVVGEESTNFLDAILLDLGRVHGIQEGMPVVTDRGLVGRISDVTDTTSKVLLLTDPSSSVTSLLGESRLNGVVRGGSSGDLIMDLIPQGPTVQTGETVLTSGLGGRFPKGIAIGTVQAVEAPANAVFQKATVRPSVDFGSLEIVMVITNFDPNEVLPEFQSQLPAEVAPGGGDVETPAAGETTVPADVEPPVEVVP